MSAVAATCHGIADGTVLTVARVHTAGAEFSWFASFSAVGTVPAQRTTAGAGRRVAFSAVLTPAVLLAVVPKPTALASSKQNKSGHR